jgi:hypothetical protein
MQPFQDKTPLASTKPFFTIYPEIPNNPLNNLTYLMHLSTTIPMHYFIVHSHTSTHLNILQLNRNFTTFSVTNSTNSVSTPS